MKKLGKPNFKTYNKSKICCYMYKEGMSINNISKGMNIPYKQVEQYLKTSYKYFFDEAFESSREKLYKKLKEIYDKYTDIYIPFFYTRKQISELINCSTIELEKMFTHYNITHQRLKTYDSQKTLCNVSEEFYDEVSKFVKENNFKSVRELAVNAIQDFILFYNLKNEDNEQTNMFKGV